jgi:hypothetical protein
MGEMHTTIWLQNVKGIDDVKDLGPDGKIILK